jgi:precorrin-6Y C5,15-methyltransferase (decarboxylating)
MDVRVTLVSVARSKPILGMTRFAALNPVYVITAQKKSGEKGESE